MGRYQDLIEFQIAKNNREVLNMLNVKYFIFPAEGGAQQVRTIQKPMETLGLLATSSDCQC